MPATAPIHAQTSRTRIGVESTIGTASSNMRDIEIIGPSPLAKVVQKTAPNNAQVRRPREYKAPVKLTKKDSPVEIQSVLVKGLVTRLTTSATPVAYSNASALSYQVLMAMLFGGELTPAAGSVVVSSSGTPVDTVTVSTGHGSRFAVGQIFVFERSGAAPVPRRVTAVATDAVSFFPPIDFTPDVASVVRNAYNNFPSVLDGTTFTVEHVPVELGSTVAQKRATGVFGSGEFTLENDAAAALSFKGEALDWTGPSDLSISDDPVADDMGDPLVWSPTILYGLTSGAAPSVAAEIATVKVTVPRKWVKVAGSVINGVGLVREVAGRGEPIMIEVEGLFDETWRTRFAANTPNEMLAYTTVGTGSSACVFGFYCGNTQVVEEPGEMPKDELIFSSAKLKAYMDDTISGATPALSTAAIRTANIIFFLA